MSRLVLAALAGFIALGFMASASPALAAPPRAVQCTGTGSVWDDTDIVHLTVPLGSGDDRISWRARGHTTLTCSNGSSSFTQFAQIEQHVVAQFLVNGPIRGHGQTRIRAGNLHHSFSGKFVGTTGVSNGTLSLSGDFNDDGKVDAADYVVWRMNMGQHGTINLASRQARFYIDDIIIGAKAR